jgi:hypothetical protein
MLRTILTAASVLALAAGAASAQNQSEELPVGTPEYTEPMPETTPSESMPADPAAVEPTASTAPDITLVATPDDLTRHSEAEFQLADANADASLDQAEFSAYADMHLLADASVVSDEGVVGEGDIDTGAQAVTSESLFADLAAGKESITKDEFLKARKASFDEADANDDDQLDETEKLQFAALVKGEAKSE